jgi:hypothetical protein
MVTLKLGSEPIFKGNYYRFNGKNLKEITNGPLVVYAPLHFF